MSSNDGASLGQVTTASCRCGYTFRCVLGGTKSQRFEEGTFPHYCDQCGVVNAPFFSDGHTCSHCRSGILIRYGTATTRRDGRLLWLRMPSRDTTTTTWNDKVTSPRGLPLHQWWDFRLTKGDHLCPQCGDMSLQFSEQVLQFFD